MAERKAPTFVKSDRPVRVYWSNEGQTFETKNKCNSGDTEANMPKSKDWEYKLEAKECLEEYRVQQRGTTAWAGNKGKCYYLVLQHCPLGLKTELKNLARWEAAADETDAVALLLIIQDVMHNKKERAQSIMLEVTEAPFF